MVSQILINILISSSLYVIIGLGFSLIYSISKFFNFALAVILTSCPYFSFLFNNSLGLPLFFAIPLAILCSTSLSCLMEILIFCPLRKKGASAIILLLSSLGLYMVFQNLISIIFGDDSKSLITGKISAGIYIIGGRLTFVQIVILFISLLFILILFLIFKKSKIGKLMMTVANDIEIAYIIGINSNNVVLNTFIIGSILTGIVGILIALDVNMTPTMGINFLMMGVVAVIIGGVGSIPGVAMGALLLGLAQHLGVWIISSQWQDAIAFIILFIFLLFKPEGFMGKKAKKTKI